MKKKATVRSAPCGSDKHINACATLGILFSSDLPPPKMPRIGIFHPANTPGHLHPGSSPQIAKMWL